MRSIADIFRSYAEFDSQGRHVGGTDKQSNHNYGDAYEDIIRWWSYSQSCEKIKLMMEVGVADGSSLLAWREVFPNAHCVGVDIHPAQRLAGCLLDRVEFHIGDQRSKRDLEVAAGGRKFDVIVEDATHRLEDSLLTLFYLFPCVRPGGLYIVEEFDNVGALRENIRELFGDLVEVYNTVGPFGGVEPLVVFRKPL